MCYNVFSNNGREKKRTEKSEQKRAEMNRGRRQKMQKSVKILGIGNSFSVDCMEYVYKILKNLGVEDIKLGNLYIGGCPLRSHCENARGDLPAYEYWKNTDDEWQIIPDFKMSDAIKEREWDYIFTQQQSGRSGLAETYDDVDELTAYVKSLAKGNYVYGWQMTWAYANYFENPNFEPYDNDQDKMYSAILNAVQTKILPRKEFERLIPSGTAIQNARAVLGDVLNRDGFHLSYDFGRFIAGLCVVKGLVGLDIDNVTYAPEGVDEEKRKLAIAAANAACKTPFAVSKL
ncbi:MAG: DUF4886 domain-containing protein [Clostridiales bacterium]|nr:DUF4886 domain-containing protein [Clostridiales bacterium]